MIYHFAVSTLSLPIERIVYQVEAIMGKNQVATRIREIIVETLSLETPITDDATRLVDDLQADSIDQVSIILALEDEFGGQIPDDQTENISTVAEVIELTWRTLQTAKLTETNERAS